MLVDVLGCTNVTCYFLLFSQCKISNVVYIRAFKMQMTDNNV